MIVLELFSGYASWSKPFRDEGYEAYTLDYDPKFNADIQDDILKWDYRAWGTRPDVIFASPDCTYFSIARARWGYPQDKLDWTVNLWNKTFEIIDYFKPKYYLIENPVGKARKYFPYGYHTVDYCMYDYKIKGLYVKKPTDLWTNISIEFRRCDRTHAHVRNMSKVVRLKAKRAVIPEKLVQEIMKVIE